MTNHLFCFGLGYSARALARELIAAGWRVSGTCRGADQAERLRSMAITAYPFDGERPNDEIAAALTGVTHLLVSIPPNDAGDPVLTHHGASVSAQASLSWIGYLSSTAVYGDRGGATVDETAVLKPESARARRRAAAEQAWLALCRSHQLPVHIFRLAGIYGPGRSALDQVKMGKARRIDKPGHLFSRIHVADIVKVLRASMARPNPGAVYNVCDDRPAASADVTAFACELLDVPPPPLIPFDQAVQDMSAMARSFWADDRRIDNRRIHDELGVELIHPDYRAGLTAIHGQAG